ncbi:MFS general substrate transporter [Flagelloscypha sp. PMI_526]|nr:MFS general substrate transporter [Flagelloscypha sp. PMI_526]
MATQHSLQVEENSTHGDSSPTSITDSPATTLHEKTLSTEIPPLSKELEESILDHVSADPSGYPDGGLRAWLVVFGSFLCACATFGLINSWGVFQSYYSTTLLKETDASSIAWIGSVQYALVFLPGLISGRLFDLGHFHIPYAFWSVMLIISIFVTAECRTYWQFLLCQGFAQGVAAGMSFGPTMAILGHWFLKRRGLALGISALGSSTGGTIFPIVARTLIPIIGFQWTIRTIGFIVLVIMGVSNLTLRRRLPPKNVKGGLINPAAFKNKAYTIYCSAQFCAFLGIYTILTYIDVSATFVGVPSDFSFYLVSIANAGSALGRFTAGYFVDKTGVVNITAPASILTAILTYTWPLIHSRSGLIGLAIPYGFSSGMVVSTFILPIYAMGEIEDVGRRTGMAFSIAALGALAGPPISGAINHRTGTYTLVGVYAGSITLVSVMCLLVTRHIMLKGKLWGKF